MAVFKGVAYCFVDNAGLGQLGGTFAFIARVAPVFTATGVDGPNFDATAQATAFTFKYGQAVTGTTPPAVPNQVQFIVLDGSGATIIYDSGVIATPADNATVSVFVNSTGAAGGTALMGSVRLKLRLIKNDGPGGVGNYDVTSDDAGQNQKGVVRVSPTTATLVEAATPGGTPRAWKDTQQVTATFGQGTKTTIASRTLTLAIRKSDLTSTIKTATSTSGTGTAYNLATQFAVDTQFPAAVTTCRAEGVVSLGDLQPTSDATWTWVSIPSGSAQFIDAKTMRTATFTVDPRVTFNTRTRTTGPAIVNYGFHTLAATFQLQNARAEVLTSADGAKATVNVNSRDSVGATVEKSLATALSPSAGGVYTLPSWIYNGPTTPAGRDSGPQNDTAAHTTAGLAKVLQAQLTATNGPLAVDTVSVIALSSWLWGDPHPQKTTALILDADPFVEPGSGESTSFTIGADVCQMFAAIGDVNKVLLGNVTAAFELYDPANNKSNTGSNPLRTTQTTGPNTGYTTTNVPFAASAPSGNWKVRIISDIDTGGTLGNYLSGVVPSANPAQIAGADQAIAFVSAYTADKFVTFQVPDEVAVGVATTIVVEYRRQDGSRATFDAAPSMRVYATDATTGVDTVELALTAMTQIAGQSAWTLTWTPSKAGVFKLEMRALFTQSGVEAVQTVTARSKFDPTAFATGDVLVDRTSVN